MALTTMCGVVGLIGSPDAAKEAFLGLTTLQHRGQDAAGILTYDDEGFHRVKNMGLVDSVFNRENMKSLTGNMAIGHARYATIGRGDLIDVQPFLINYPFGIGLVHNGQVVNCPELQNLLQKKYRRHLLTRSDSEILLNLLAEGLSHLPPDSGDDLSFDQICQAVQTVYEKVNGSFSVVTLVAGKGLLAFRDPHSIRPLIWGKRDNRRTEDEGRSGGMKEAHMVASESVALAFNGYDVVRHLAPGEVLFISTDGTVHTRVLKGEEPRPCMFEWVYFASPESEIDGIPVYATRIQLGRHLAAQVKTLMQEKKIDVDVIVPVPDSSRVAAIALAEELGIPFRETLIKNRYIKRTFILDTQEKRHQAVSLKLSPVKSEIVGKKILLVDDSIVRGTTSKKLIELMRRAGAEKVYFVSTCPPIRYPCYYGIDFPNEEELLAFRRDQSEIEEELGVDAVVYQDLEGLRRSIIEASKNPSHRDSKFKPCMACLDGKYPTDVTAGVKMAENRKLDRVK